MRVKVYLARPNLLDRMTACHQQHKGFVYSAMMSKRPLIILRIWMLCTRVFSGPIVLIYWIAHRRMGADPKRFSDRLGRGSAGLGDPVLWFHAASLGEVMQIAPLVGHLAQTEQTKILVTTTTATTKL